MDGAEIRRNMVWLIASKDSAITPIPPPPIMDICDSLKAEQFPSSVFWVGLSTWLPE